MANPFSYRVVLESVGNKSDIFMSDDVIAEQAQSLVVGKVKKIGYHAYKGDPRVGDGRQEYKIGDLVYVLPYSGKMIRKKDGSIERVVNDNEIYAGVEEDDDIDSMVGNYE